MARQVDFVLIHPPYHRRKGSGTIFPIGLGYLASAAENIGYKVSIIDCALFFGSLLPSQLSQLGAWLEPRLKSMNPRLGIGIGPCTTSSIRGTEAVAHICKNVLPNIPIIYGGPLASLPGQASLFFDKLGASAVVPGDGEKAICDILITLSGNSDLSHVHTVITPGKDDLMNVVEDLDSLPFPRRLCSVDSNGYVLSVRRDLFLGKYATMISSRGCPHRCKFCVSAHLHKGIYNRRSLDNIFNEISFLQDSHINVVVFYDDTFFVKPDSLAKDAHDLATGMFNLARPLYWQAEMRPEVLAMVDKNVAALLYAAGCRQLNIGIEKLDSSCASLMGKDVDIDKIRRAVRNINSEAPNLRLTGTFILGGPQENQNSILKTIELASDLGLLFAHFYPLEVYPGTDMYRECFPNDGPLDWYEKIVSDDLPWGELLYENALLTRTDLLAMVNEGYKSFYTRNEWHQMAHQSLGANYSKVANVVKEWCVDRFSIKKETL